MSHTTRFLALALSLLAAALAPSAPAATRVVAYDGQQAPGMPAGVTFDPFGGFYEPRIDNLGRVAFTAGTRKPDLALGDNGLWTERTGTLTLLARQNAAAPGTSASFVSLHGSRLALTKSGHVVFRTGLSGGNFGYFSDRTGALAPIAYEGMSSLSIGGALVSFDTFDRLLVDGDGFTVFDATLDNEATGPSALFQEFPAGVGRLVLEGDPAGWEDYDYSSTTGIGSPFALHAMNSAGHVLFGSAIDSPTDSDHTSALYRHSPGAISLVAINQTVAPGAGVARYTAFSDPAMNDAGLIVFASGLAGTGVTDANNHGIWYGPANEFELLMRDGSPAPNTPAGVTFSNSPGGVTPSPVINASGKALFHYGLTGPGVTAANDMGLWVGVPGNVVKLVREGDPAPSVGPSATFTSINTQVRAINANGQVAFASSFSDGAGSGYGLFAQDAAGVIQLIARTGQSIQLAPGVTRTIESLDVNNTGPTGNQDGRETFFNDLGHLAFRATFTDDTDAILVSDLVAAPPLLAADFDSDGDVDGFDLARWRTNFGRTTGADRGLGDANSDGRVDAADYLVWQSQVGSVSAQAALAAVPEPHALAAILPALLMLARARRPRRRWFPQSGLELMDVAPAQD